MKKKLGIISGFGNYKSVTNLINYLKISYTEVVNPEDMDQCSHLILPGVGSYAGVMDELKKRNFINQLKKNILVDKKYFLGICVGMQVLFSVGLEDKQTEGLGILKGRVIRFKKKKKQKYH